jgi:hypothetical protein
VVVGELELSVQLLRIFIFCSPTGLKHVGVGVEVGVWLAAGGAPKDVLGVFVGVADGVNEILGVVV